MPSGISNMLYGNKMYIKTMNFLCDPYLSSDHCLERYLFEDDLKQLQLLRRTFAFKEFYDHYENQ